MAAAHQVRRNAVAGGGAALVAVEEPGDPVTVAVARRIALRELLFREVCTQLAHHRIDGLQPLVAWSKLDDLHRAAA
jgi:hypothetical protein